MPLLLAALLALSACGDDGPGNDIPPAAYCDDVADWPAADIDFENEVLVLVNQQRSQGASCGGQSMPAVSALAMEPALRCASRVHTADMDEREYFSHTNPDGLGPADRVELAGYDWRAIGENIAGGQPDPASVMSSWMSSPGHCSNIMSANYTEIGIGYVPGLWTQVFAAPR